jgi:hypothetical protein
MTAGSLTVRILVLAGFFAVIGAASGAEANSTLLNAEPECGPNLHQRTPQQVLADFRAALAAGNWAAVRCNLDDDAVMISDSGVTNGEDEIIEEFQALSRFFGGTEPGIASEIVVSVLGGNRYMARQLYFIDTACVDIPDGANTYIIKGGQIAAITTHGFAVFSC